LDRARLTTRLKLKEGLRLNAYRDSLGFWTICYGHLLGPAPWPASADCGQCDSYLRRDIDAATSLAVQYPFYASLDEPRQNATVELAFNLANKLKKFTKFLAAMASKDYTTAGQELKDSLAYKQEPHRFDELITALSTGEFPV
jgi:lysozyme